MRRTDREITDPTEIADILRNSDACHLALVDDGKPYLVALNYGFSWDATKEGTLPVIYFHCANAGKKLDIIRKNDAAAFFIDTGHELVRGEKDCDWSMKYRSVAGNGSIAFVEETAEKKRGLDLLMNHYSGRTEFSYDEALFARTVILKLTVSSISGKKKA
jgi:nitroimidazol reductase NimA-like FMN-containing flavoprotein (pyridoxamine 5'-phosphate oxidase superfamily)